MGKTFNEVYVGDIVYILHNGGTLSEAKITQYDRGKTFNMISIYTGDERIGFCAQTNTSSKLVPELHGTVYADLNDVLDAVKDQMRIVEKKADFLLMTQAKVLTKLKEQK